MRDTDVVRSRVESDIANLWTDGRLRCVLSWAGQRYRLRLMRGAYLVREEFHEDERFVLDLSLRWRVEQLCRVIGWNGRPVLGK